MTKRTEIERLPVIGGPACGVSFEVGVDGTVLYEGATGRTHTYYRAQMQTGVLCLLHSGIRDGSSRKRRKRDRDDDEDGGEG